jgi:YjbE family integral membrane protein
MALVPSVDPATVSAFLGIVLISLTMSGDNALVIGMAAHGLPDQQRRWAVGLAIFGAIAFRVVFAGIFAILLYETEVIAVRLVGGVVLVWIAWKLIVDPPHKEGDENNPDDSGLVEAVVLILVADASMSLDNMLAVAAASNGRVLLIGFGLMISIPLLFLGATAISRVLESYPQLVWVGGGIIAYVSGELILEEPLLVRWFDIPHQAAGIAVSTLGGLAVLLLVMVAAYLQKRADDDPVETAV